MFREMRRKKQLLSNEDVMEILEKSTSGVLAVIGDDDYPYAVPVSYVYYDSRIYFHGGKTGHKIDSINKNAKVSFCIIDKDDIVKEEYTTYFRSVIAFGKAYVIEDEKEIMESIEKLSIKYYPEDSEENRNKAIEREKKALCMVRIDIEHVTGKEAIELVKMKNK